MTGKRLLALVVLFAGLVHQPLFAHLDEGHPAHVHYNELILAGVVILLLALIISHWFRKH